MKVAGAICASVFTAVRPHIRPGISTAELDKIITDTIRSQGANPACLNYGDPPFPGAACISINEEVVHGIPSKDRILQDGDIVTIDVVAEKDSYHGDAARTFFCGDVCDEWRELVRVTRECFWKGLAMAQVGKRLGDISHAVQVHAESHGYGVVRDLSGHGIGRDMHEDPDLLNFGRAGRGIRLEAGLCLALEPMITLGDYHVEMLSDEWTIVTADGSPAAHYENSFAVTEDGPLIFTLEPGETAPF